jgi:hypothetical protein
MIMDTQQVMVHGWISQDGSLEVAEKLNLPPDPVDITVQPAAARLPRRDTFEVLQEIWAERAALGLKARSAEEIDAEINALRNDSEEEIAEVERLYQNVRRRKG